MFLVGCAYYLVGKNNLKGMVVILLMIIACYSVLTYQRNKVWRSEITLWDDTVRKSPHKARSYDTRGIAYAQGGNFSQAISDYSKAIEIIPDFAEAYNNRGNAYCDKGDFVQAVSDYNRAIEIKPNFKDAYFNRAVAYYQIKQYDKAWADVHKVERLGYAVNPKLIQWLKNATGREQ